MTPEGRVKERCKQRLKELGCFYFMPVSNGMGRHGIPDIIVCQPVTITEEMVGETVGLFAGVETKALGKRKNVSALQKKCIKEINESGGLAIVVDAAEQMEDLWLTKLTSASNKTSF